MHRSRQGFREIFQMLNKGRWGNHSTSLRGSDGDRLEETKPYEFGDPLNVNIGETLLKALEKRKKGAPLRIAPEDFSVHRVEYSTVSETALLIDVSYSMLMNDALHAGKKVALALHRLIQTSIRRQAPSRRVPLQRQAEPGTRICHPRFVPISWTRHRITEALASPHCWDRIEAQIGRSFSSPTANHGGDAGRGGRLHRLGSALLPQPYRSRDAQRSETLHSGESRSILLCRSISTAKDSSTSCRAKYRRVFTPPDQMAKHRRRYLNNKRKRITYNSRTSPFGFRF